MLGYHFSKNNPLSASQKNPFDSLLKVFMQLLLATSGNANEALRWLTEIDRQYNMTGEKYGIADFIEELKEKNYLDTKNPNVLRINKKGEQELRKSTLEEVFGKLRKSGKGEHKTRYSGPGNEMSMDRKSYEFGDNPEYISITDSLKNAQINHGIDSWIITENDLEVSETEFRTQTSTVLMIDISHSMILYGEDRITPAKKVAMALVELITKKYPKDTLDILVFGNDAWPIEIKDLLYLEVGPYHTNTVAGLELAMNMLRKKKTYNKQIFMITDGKPTCIKNGLGYYKNSFGLDPKILNKTLNLAGQLRKLKIPVTTFMIASDPYLKMFVKEFTETNNGMAYYSDLQELGSLVFKDFKKNRKRNL